MRTSLVVGLFVGWLSVVPGSVVASDEAPKWKPADEQAVREAVDMYFNGVTRADRELLEKAWYANGASMKYVQDVGADAGKFKDVKIPIAFDWWTRTKPKSASGKILSLDIVGDSMALVKFEFLYDHFHYIDFLTLYKIDGEWKLVSKTFVRLDNKKPDGTVKPGAEAGDAAAKPAEAAKGNEAPAQGGEAPKKDPK